MKRGEYPHNFIRFGVQRKRNFLRDFRELYDGLVIPANILLYQYKKTPLLVHACKGKPFAIDPMTYLFGYPSFELFIRRTREGRSDFKPSFRRLLEEHGLTTGTSLKGRSDVFRYLASGEHLRSFVRRSITLQTDTVLKNFTKYAAPLLEEEFDQRDFSPNFLISPYFFLTAESRPAAELARRIFDEAMVLTGEVNEDVYAMLFITRDGLVDGSALSLSNAISERGFPGSCLWVEDFREQDATSEDIVRLVEVVRTLSREGANYVLNMYGGFFSMLLYHFGLGGVAHGILYSESRAVQDTVRRAAGPVLIRYYVPALHQFLTLQNAIRTAIEDPTLLCTCQACSRVVRGDPENIAKFQEEESLAEFHFLLNRANEKVEIGRSSLEDITGNLLATYRKYSDSDWATGRGKFLDEPVQNLNYLKVWAETLRGLA